MTVRNERDLGPKEPGREANPLLFSSEFLSLIHIFDATDRGQTGRKEHTGNLWFLLS